jgi:hypothetical protein
LRAVQVGLSTDLLRRRGRAEDENLYFSIVTATETFDLQAATPQERDFLVSRLQALVP